jgi:hypothetical protein
MQIIGITAFWFGTCDHTFGSPAVGQQVANMTICLLGQNRNMSSKKETQGNNIIVSKYYCKHEKIISTCFFF